MKITPILCPACGAMLRVEKDEPLATCTHCDISVMIEWPTTATKGPPAAFRISDPSSPIAVCPHCAAQVLRSAESAGTKVDCSSCGEAALLPAVGEYRASHCARHDVVYMSYQGGCPECARERRLVD